MLALLPVITLTFTANLALFSPQYTNPFAAAVPPATAAAARLAGQRTPAS
jgi:hypothetical protein